MSIPAGSKVGPSESVSPDGTQFFMIKEQSRAILNVVLNWFDELNAKMK